MRDGENDPGRLDELLSEIVTEAIAGRASDIHLEPFATFLRIRFRVDGRLIHFRDLGKELHAALLIRLKVLCKLPPDQKQLPQDGKWTYVCGEESRDIRVSMIPFLHGEGVVLRILKNFTEIPDLEALGFDLKTASILRSLAHGPDGLLLLTGPTGSGKSTTAHALLRDLNDGTRKIMTVEDPVEYVIDGVQSVQVRETNGLHFADALRAVLRQSPDLLLIGEIRDSETAAIAIQAALTGHFVCSTLHCGGAAAAFSRLQQLGISTSLAGSVLRGVLAQRLVRRLCDHCKEPHSPAEELCAALGLGAGANIFRAAGCDLCDHSGYRGQMAVYEWMPMAGFSEEERTADEIFGKISPTLADCSRSAVLDGRTSIEEILGIFLDSKVQVSHNNSPLNI
jgi:general secretion pathway protein E